MENIFLQYIEWHLIDTPRGILRAWKNCLKFNLNYWSVVILIKTFFSHWRRYRFDYGKGFDFKRYLEAWSFNMISRALGVVLRSVFVVLGLISEVFIFLAGMLVLAVWISLPVLMALGFFYGVRILF